MVMGKRRYEGSRHQKGIVGAEEGLPRRTRCHLSVARRLEMFVRVRPSLSLHRFIAIILLRGPFPRLFYLVIAQEGRKKGSPQITVGVILRSRINPGWPAFFQMGASPAKCFNCLAEHRFDVGRDRAQWIVKDEAEAKVSEASPTGGGE
jgi:hypothetical protein